MEKMIRLDDGRCIIGFDDGYQLGKTAYLQSMIADALPSFLWYLPL